MGRLFWKIFLAFWVAMLLIAAGAAVATSQLARGLQEQALERSARLTDLADDAAGALSAGGVAGLTEWLRATVEREGDYIYIMDGERELLGRRPPRRTGRPLPPPPRGPEGRPDRPRRDRGPRRGEPGAPRGPRPILGGDTIDVRVITGSGERYHLLADVGLRPQDLLRSPLVATVWVGLAIGISGTVCFFLAGYIVTPLRRMRRTTRRFTAGELDARVGETGGGRKDEIVDLGRDIDSMAEHIGRMLTSQRRLLRDLSHELRSPLARLQVALELARKRASAQAGNELERIELEAERLNALIGEILTLARLESSPHTLDRSTIDLTDLVESVAGDADYEAKSSEKRVRFEAGTPIPYEGNEELLRRAVENVVRNAARHTAKGTTVDVSVRRDAEEITIQIHDQGPGVPQSSLGQIFDPFYRDPESRAGHPVGYGIGLAIAKRAIEVHGGAVTAGNHAGGGLVVKLRLPAPGGNGDPG